MKNKFLLLFLIISFYANAQKSSYVKNRLTLDISYLRMNYSLVQQNQEKQNGISLSANYGITKFLESGIYYSRYKLYFHAYNFVGIQNRLHLLPFIIESNNRFFRLDAYLSNQTGSILYQYMSNNWGMMFTTDIGIGTAMYLYKHLGIRFEYRWCFLLSKHVENPNFQNGFNLGISLKF